MLSVFRAAHGVLMVGAHVYTACCFQAMLATAQRHSPEEIALRAIPALGPLAVDPIAEVCWKLGLNDSYYITRYLCTVPCLSLDMLTGTEHEPSRPADIYQEFAGQCTVSG